jgi:hypothetical protein
MQRGQPLQAPRQQNKGKQRGSDGVTLKRLVATSTKHAQASYLQLSPTQTLTRSQGRTPKLNSISLFLSPLHIGIIMDSPTIEQLFLTAHPEFRGAVVTAFERNMFTGSKQAVVFDVEGNRLAIVQQRTFNTFDVYPTID